MAAQYARYSCRAVFYPDQAGASAPFKGCSVWYSPSTWDAVEAKREAVAAAKEACLANSDGAACYIAGCSVAISDLPPTSSECPSL
jgi:hypothetical protein